MVMAKEFPSDPEVARLLDEMEARVLDSSVLVQEWRGALTAWPGSATDPRSALRFREWFLLERVSPALGSPPAAVWSPAETGEPETDPWARLLGSYFGIFRPVLAEEELAFADLWSGRVVRLTGDLPEPGPDLLLHGRVAPAGEATASLLPGWRVTRGLDLAEAIADDLQRARAAQPRARLSQLECERLWTHRAGPAIEAGAAAPKPEAFLAELERILLAAPDWPLERALEILEQDGAEALLEQLAFETDLPLEPLRGLLAELRAAALAAESAPASSAADAQAELDLAEIQSALARFDAERAAGADAKAAWAKLEAELELEGGPLEALKAPWLEEGEPIGPSALPGLAFWVDAWVWEQSQVVAPPSAEEIAVAREFAAFVEALRAVPSDAAEIKAQDLWAFLTASANADQLEQRRRHLMSFLRWLRVEQDAPLPLEELESSTGPTWKRLDESVRLNAAQRGQLGRGTQAARVWKTGPVQVLTENQEGALVLGFPEQTAALVRPGDTLAGRWVAGSFRLCAWFPSV